jgi:Uma2 family endonuclease
MSTQTLNPPIEIDQANPITGEDLYKMGNIGPSELVKGEIVRMTPTGFMHGRVEHRIARALDAFLVEHKLGEIISGEVGIYTGRNPDTVRAPDVAFISNERIAKVKSKSYLDTAPELIVEVLSPDDPWSELMEKLDEYFSIGVKLVWVADPRKRQVYVYQSATKVQRFDVNNTLTGGDVLPGFGVAVADLFVNE